MLNLINKIVSIFPKPLQDLYHKYEDLVLYLIFGVLTTIVSFGSQLLIALIMGTETYLATTVATAFSWICAVTFAFFTNKVYVFKSVTDTKKAFWTEFVSFYSARALSLALEIGIMNLFATKLGFNYWVVKIMAQIFIMLTNYLLSKLVIFKNKAKQ